MLIYKESKIKNYLEIHFHFEDSDKVAIVHTDSRYIITFVNGKELVKETGIIKRLVIPFNNDGEDVILVFDCSKEGESNIIKILSSAIRDIEPANSLLKTEIITSTEYEQLTEKSSDKMYLLTDTKQIYVGEKLYSNAVLIVEEFPEHNILPNVLYYNTSTFEGKVYNGSGWFTMFTKEKPTVDNILSSNTAF